MRLTLDTNLPVEYWKVQDRADVIERLLTLAESGELDLAVTSRIREDIPRSPLADRLNELSMLNVTEAPSVIRFGFWQMGQNVFGDQEFINFSKSVDDILKQRGARIPDWRDWDHVHTHYALKRDIFLTWDKPLLSIAPELQAKFGIIVTTPESYFASRA